MALATTTAEADARLIRKTKEPNVPGFTLERMWPFIDATVADTLSTTLDAVATYSGPKADNQTYSGTFVHSKVVAEEGENDHNERYVNIKQTVILISAVANIADLAAVPSIILQKNEIKAALAIQTGEEDTIAYRFFNLNPANRAVLMGLADADLVTNISGAGWTYVDRTFDEQKDGTAIFTVIFKKVAWNAWSHDSYASDMTETELFGDIHERRKKTWLRIDDDDVQTALTAAKNDADANVGADAGYHIVGAKQSYAEDGSVTITQDQIRMFAWGHDSYAHDSIEYDNAGTANEKERVTKRWFNIDYSNLAAAVADVRAGTNTAATAGYIITDAGVKDNGNGTIDIVQVQFKQVTNIDVGTSTTPGIVTFNPLGWDGGRHDYINTHYERFTATGLATAIGSESAPAGYTLDTLTPSLGGDGLHNLVYHYIKATFSNTSGTTPNRVLANTRVFGYKNYDPQNAVSGLDVHKTDGGSGIPIAALAEIRDNQVADSGWGITGVRIDDDGNGAGSLLRTQVKKASTSNNFYRTWYASNGNQQETEIIEWYNLSATDATTIYNDAKTNTLDMTGATPAAPASHQLRLVDRIPAEGVDSAGDNLFNVRRVTFIPNSGGSVWWSNDNGFGYFWYYRQKDGIRVGVEHLRTNSISDAYSFIRGETVDGHAIDTNENAMFGTTANTPVVIPHDSGNATNVERIAHEKYLAVRVLMQDVDIGS